MSKKEHVRFSQKQYCNQTMPTLVFDLNSSSMQCVAIFKTVDP